MGRIKSDYEKEVDAKSNKQFFFLLLISLAASFFITLTPGLESIISDNRETIGGCIKGMILFFGLAFIFTLKSWALFLFLGVGLVGMFTGFLGMNGYNS